MAEPIRVTVRRGETVESVHLVHAVAVRDGEVMAEAGDPGLVTFMRSSAKPIQAMPLGATKVSRAVLAANSGPPYTLTSVGYFRPGSNVDGN